MPASMPSASCAPFGREQLVHAVLVHQGTDSDRWPWMLTQ